MNDSTPRRSHGRMPSDAQMDHLLRDFFRLETPTELNHSFRVPFADATSRPALTVAQGGTELKAPVQINRRFAVASALTVLALSLIVMIQMRESAPATGSPVTNTEGEHHSPESPDEQLMLVSPQGDSGAQTNQVGDDGVTLEETDSIEVKPLRSAEPK